MDHNKKHKNSRNLSNNQQQQNSEDVVAQSNNEQQSDAVAGSSSSNHGSVAENSAANVSHAPAVPSTSDGKKGVHATKSCPNDSAFRNPAASFSCNKQPNAQGASHSSHRAISNNTRKNKRYSNMGIDLLSEVPTSKANDGSGAPVPGCSHSAAIPSFQAPALHGLPVAPADAEMEDDDDEEGSGFAHHCPIDQLSHPIGMEVGLVNNAQPLPAVVPAEHDAAAAPENVKEEAPMMVDQLANHEQQQNQEQQHFAPQAEDENEPHVVPYNWQASKTNVKERLAYMFNNEVMADVHFVVGKGHMAQRIPAHRFVLSTGSAVFDAMFYGGMATKSETVDLPDVEPAAFLALLKFLYSDEVQIGPETVMTTLYTAKKYAVPALEKACVDFLKRNLGSDNAFMLLTQARLFDEPQLAALCLETIDKNTSDALAAEGFLDIDLDTLCVVLARDTLGIRECKLFAAVCRWAEAECHRRHVSATADQQRIVLSKALKLVRFPLMTVEEFAMGAAQSKILTDREVVELFLHFTVNPKPSVAFLDVPRCCLTGKEQVVSRFIQIESRWGYSGTSDRIRFMVNRRIFVVGFGLYGSIHGPSEYQVQIQVLHTDTGKVCGHNDTSFQCDGANSTFRVMFKEPVEIQANASYTACATLKGSDSYYGTKGLRKVTHESVTSGKVTFHFSYAAGNNNGTSVEDGQIPEIIFYRYT